MLNWAQSSTPSTVGPGSYNTLTALGNRKQMKRPFGATNEFCSIPVCGKDSPPVGSYHTEIEPRAVVHRQTFSKEPRDKPIKSDVPSPAAYSNISSWIRDARPAKRIVPPRPEKKFFKDLPTSKKRPQPELGILLSMDNPKRGQEWIGPGTYNAGDLAGFFTPKYTLSIAKSQPLSCLLKEKVSCTPGPANYNVSLPNSRLNHAIRPRPQETIPEDESPATFVGPTPWAYAYSETSHAFRSKSQRFYSPSSQEGPGPADYFLDDLPPLPSTTHPSSRKPIISPAPFCFSQCSSHSTFASVSVEESSSRSSVQSSMDSNNDLPQAIAKPQPRACSVITKSLQRERRIKLDSPSTDTFWMVEEVEAEAKRPKLVQRMKQHDL